MLEGEKALRSEAARQLKEVEKKLVSLRSPAVSLSSPMVAPPGSLSSLEREQDQLQQQIRAHSAQVSHDKPVQGGATLGAVVYIRSLNMTHSDVDECVFVLVFFGAGYTLAYCKP